MATPKKSKKTNSTRKRSVVAAVLLLVCVGLVTSLIYIVVLRSDQSQWEQTNNQLSSLNTVLTSYQDRPLGVVCGVVDEDFAARFIGAEVVRLPESGQRYFTPSNNTDSMAWSDACLYESTNTKSLYVNIYLSYYETNQIAREQLQFRVPPVNEVKTLTDTDTERTLYDAGVIYSAQDNILIEVAASNGRLVDMQSHVTTVYDEFLRQFSEYR